MIKLKDIFAISEEDLLLRLNEELLSAGYKPCSAFTDGYIWAPGSIPIMLIAHVDCVSGHAETVFHDPSANVFWSPDGLGADDRAGVWGILYLIAKGFRPSILFTDGEEKGGWGARAAKKLIPDIGDVRALIEIDRRGEMEAVFYSCGNEDIKAWVEGVGFEKGFGTFSDVSILGPAWDVAAVNVSAGYYMEHQRAEFLVVDHLMATLAAIEKLLRDPPADVWPHETKHTAISLWQGKCWNYVPGEAGWTSKEEIYPEYSEKYGKYSDDEWDNWDYNDDGKLVWVGEPNDEPIESSKSYRDDYIGSSDVFPIPCDNCEADIMDAASLHLWRDEDDFTWILCEVCEVLFVRDEGESAGGEVSIAEVTRFGAL